MRKESKLICILTVFLVVALLVAACGYQTDNMTDSATTPPEDKRLTIYTPLSEEVYLPLVREFENRMGIWVEVETGNAISKLESVASGEENTADLLLGCQSDVIESFGKVFSRFERVDTPAIPKEYTSTVGLWHPFTINHLVVIYNSKLLSENQPSGWKGILQSGWNKQVAYLSIDQSDVGYMTLLAIADALNISIEEARILLEPGVEFDTSEKVLDAVAHGKCYFGIVTEDVAIRAIADDSDIDVIYPKEGAYLYPSGIAIFDSCAHEENARLFIEFIQEKEVQEYLEAHYALHSIYKQVTSKDVGNLLDDHCPDSRQKKNDEIEEGTEQTEEVSE